MKYSTAAKPVAPGLLVTMIFGLPGRCLATKGAIWRAAASVPLPASKLTMMLTVWPSKLTACAAGAAKSTASTAKAVAEARRNSDPFLICMRHVSSPVSWCQAPSAGRHHDIAPTSTYR